MGTRGGGRTDRRASQFKSLVGGLVGVWEPPIRVGLPSAISHATFPRCPFNTTLSLLSSLPSFPSHSFFPSLPLTIHPPTPTHSFPPCRTSHPTSQMPLCKKRRAQLIHPPFPSLAWVMTAEANPPSSAYAYGYVRNARVQNGMHAHARLPGQCAVPPARPHLPRLPRSTRPLPPPPPSPTRAKTATVPVEHDGTFMETVDYRLHDPPSRPFVPWLEGYALRGRGAQRSTDPDTTTPGVSKCRSDGSAAGSDDARSKKRKRMWTRTRTRTRTTVESKRLVIVLSALRRACGLSAKEEPRMLT